MLGLSKMRELADGARAIKRNPVKTQFIEDEREIVRHFFNSQHNRGLGSKRMRSFLALCKLLGEPLDASRWHCLEDADIVGNLHFLVGGGTVKSGNDWQLKCLGLKEVGNNSGVFVVGVNQLFFDHADAYWVDRMPKDDGIMVSEVSGQFATVANVPDFSGRWSNQRNSLLILKQAGESVTGTFDSGVGDNNQQILARIVGWANGDLIAFTATYPEFGTVVAWVGQMAGEPGNPELITHWLHETNVPDDGEPTRLWTSTRIGTDRFTQVKRRAACLPSDGNSD